MPHLPSLLRSGFDPLPMRMATVQIPPSALSHPSHPSHPSHLWPWQRRSASSALSRERSSRKRSAKLLRSIQANRVVKFNPNRSEATIAKTGASKLRINNLTIYIGTQQASPINQNPVMVAFRNGKRQWVRSHETTAADGTGYGLFSNGKRLYALFSIDGTQGTPNQDFRAVASRAAQPWLRSYGAGGGAKITVVAQVDPATGRLVRAAHLSAVLSNGQSNSLLVRNAKFNAVGNVVLTATAYFSPRRPDGQPMAPVQSGLQSPFTQTIELKPSLTTVVKTSAPGWST